MKVSKNIIFSENANEGSVILANIVEASDDFFKLKDVGKDVWRHIVAGKNREEIHQNIAASYEPYEAAERRQVDEFINHLIEKKFVIES